MAVIETGFVGDIIQPPQDLSYNFAGDGFSAKGIQVGGSDLAEVFTTGDVHLLMEYPNSTVTLGNLTCQSSPPAAAPADCHYTTGPFGQVNAINGSLELHSDPVPVPPPGTTFTEPFTATGSLVIGDGLDLTGQGTVSVSRCPTCFSLEDTEVRYTFTVDEPSSWGLMLAAIAALVIGRFWRAVNKHLLVKPSRAPNLAP
jgi:hypothetical protein